MRFGGPSFGGEDPEDWARGLKASSYRATYCPIGADASDDLIAAYIKAAAKVDVLITEVGAWSNPISPDDTIRNAAIEHCCRQLDLADRIGAKCCVNIAGSRGDQWDGPHPDNLIPETFDLIVETVRKIIDVVKPKRAFYALETMPWVYPDSPESYANLIDAIDRPQFAVHLDPVNLINSPHRYYRNAYLIRDCFAKLGPRIVSCHAKDIKLAGNLTVHLDEVRPGLGTLDYVTFLTELNRLGPDVSLLLEHLPDEAEYNLAAAHIRSVAGDLGITV